MVCGKKKKKKKNIVYRRRPLGLRLISLFRSRLAAVAVEWEAGGGKTRHAVVTPMALCREGDQASVMRSHQGAEVVVSVGVASGELDLTTDAQSPGYVAFPAKEREGGGCDNAWLMCDGCGRFVVRLTDPFTRRVFFF